MLRPSLKSLGAAMKRTLIFKNQHHVWPSCGLHDVERVSFVNLIQFSTQSSDRPESSEIIRIYEGPLSTRLRRTKLFSFSTSFLSFSGCPVLLEKIQQFPEKAGWYLALLSVVSGFSFGTPVLLQILAKKYILHIDYNSSKDLYTLYTYTLFLNLKSASFKATDVALVTSPLATVSIRGQGYLLEPSNFIHLEHYKRMVGYDKEFDFKLPEDKNLTSDEPELKRPKAPTPDYQTASFIDREKRPEDDGDLPLNLRKKNR